MTGLYRRVKRLTEQNILQGLNREGPRQERNRKKKEIILAAQVGVA